VALAIVADLVRQPADLKALPDSPIRRAVAAGATVIEEPLDTSYGARRAMVRDRFGNLFQIGPQLPAR
jgi:uncharacterized glyoxalase superfamily protein PhnB